MTADRGWASNFPAESSQNGDLAAVCDKPNDFAEFPVFARSEPFCRLEKNGY
jgi:hypothetical protein